MTTRRPFFVLLLALAFSGCAALRSLVGLGPLRPKVRVTDIQVTKATPLALDLVVGIRVDNPNDFELDFSKLHYQLVAAGLTVATGNYAPHIVVKENASADLQLPLSIDAGAVLKLVHQLVSGNDDISTVTSAVADFETPFGAMTVDFDDKRPLRKLAGF